MGGWMIGGSSAEQRSGLVQPGVDGPHACGRDRDSLVAILLIFAVHEPAVCEDVDGVVQIAGSQASATVSDLNSSSGSTCAHLPVLVDTRIVAQAGPPD